MHRGSESLEKVIMERKVPRRRNKGRQTNRYIDKFLEIIGRFEKCLRAADDEDKWCDYIGLLYIG